MLNENDYWRPPQTSSARWLIGSSILGVILIIICLLLAFKNSISFYVTPRQLHGEDYRSAYNFRIGGYVRQIVKDGKCINFLLSDRVKDIKIHYCAFIPRLFRTGQEVVVDGTFESKKNGEYVFMAKQLLTKHDEYYHPPQ